MSTLIQYSVPLWVTCIALVIYWADPAASLMLRYDRSAIEQGELWRLISGHLCHLGNTHLWFNLAGLWLLSFLLNEALGVWRWLLAFSFSVVGTSVGLWFFLPEVDTYVGLSGALHGLIVAGAIWDMRNVFVSNVLLLAGVTVKLIWEHSPYYSNDMSTLVGGQVLVDSHLSGAISGVVIVLLVYFTVCLRVKIQGEDSNA